MKFFLKENRRVSGKVFYSALLCIFSLSVFSQDSYDKLETPLKRLIDNSLQEDRVASFKMDFNGDGYLDLFYSRARVDRFGMDWNLALFDGEKFNTVRKKNGTSFVVAAHDLPHDLVWVESLKKWGVLAETFSRGVATYNLYYLDEEGEGVSEWLGRKCLHVQCENDDSIVMLKNYRYGKRLDDDYINSHLLPVTPIKQLISDEAWKKKFPRSELPENKWNMQCPYEWSSPAQICRLFDRETKEFLGYFDLLNGYYVEVKFNADGSIADVKKLGHFKSGEPPVRMKEVPPEAPDIISEKSDGEKDKGNIPDNANPEVVSENNPVPVVIAKEDRIWWGLAVFIFAGLAVSVLIYYRLKSKKAKG